MDRFTAERADEVHSLDTPVPIDPTLTDCFRSWGVELEETQDLCGFLVKGRDDQVMFLTYQTLENIVILKKAGIAKSRIKEVLQSTGIDFEAMAVPQQQPLTLETQLQRTIHGAVFSAVRG